MRLKKKAFTTALALLLCLALLPLNSFASFPTDYDALIYDSTYFKDRGFDTASSMIASATAKTCESFILVFYSRYDSLSKKVVPQLQTWAEENETFINGIDQHNRYTAEYGYFNSKTYFVGWETYIKRADFSFPAVFIYNSNTRIMTAKSGIDSVETFEALMEQAGMGNTQYHRLDLAQKQAEQLNELGLFLGTGVDFALERRPIRTEALAMLIRIIGKEEEALLLNLSHPFTDVPAWASPYVGYAYATGLTNGISATRFGSNDPATSAQYLTFVLRALGYNSGEDFEWYSPYALALKAGILPDGANIYEFLRAEMVMVTRSALNVSLKGSRTTLGDQLVSLCAITAEQYKSATDAIANYTPVEKELQKDNWDDYVMIDPKSPAYTTKALEAMTYYCPRLIYFTTMDGHASDWAEYLSYNLSFDKRIVKSYSINHSGSVVLIEFEYTAAAKILAQIFLKDYQGSFIDIAAADAVKGYLADMAETNTAAWLEDFWSTITLLEDTEEIYNDADSALLLKMSTVQGIENAKLVMEKALQHQRHIK